MFKLEKVFQNDDSRLLLLSTFKIYFIYISIYIFSILKDNSIFDLNKTLFINSKFFYYSIILVLYIL